ncbi:NucA/NucB deoxyribonuclease domain-containing protein [Streptomyces sp. NPDC059863]|uniref:NucA/NucB deoxyribonuclease domain-containing protein n=1 Tax=unclassified Streptomyces TaxID=2593676 RepID=UPI0036590BB0
MRNHDKNIPGKYLGGEGALHRIPYRGTVWQANSDEKDRACERRGRYRHTDLPVPQGGWLGKECDEYPFASTQEGANSPRHDFSVEAVTAAHNSRAGRMLRDFYKHERVLYRQDGFYVQIT